MVFLGYHYLRINPIYYFSINMVMGFWKGGYPKGGIHLQSSPIIFYDSSWHIWSVIALFPNSSFERVSLDLANVVPTKSLTNLVPRGPSRVAMNWTWHEPFILGFLDGDCLFNIPTIRWTFPILRGGLLNICLENAWKSRDYQSCWVL